ncbi:autotransporter outer membrane beta-barrel domain-containing protein [Vibrio alfacsensis]|uniref:autotransporter outer membrane beta-barrel domain-containing protein n=1 Tax=Vibrio alfacsensis TaxID=1074311 RepID=UPI002ADE86E0|nr:autotransporter outer membrane beta-barrel domain-containing protein [Vibrio alfacsensis]WQE77890.1 autotransporter outer membrane beta-barrel domain-containing protein [Vibrio alfacsensis]
MKKTILSQTVFLALMTCSLNVNAGFADDVANNGASKTEVEFAKYIETVDNAELKSLLNSVSGQAAKELASDILADSNGAMLNAVLNNSDMVQDSIIARSGSIREQSNIGMFNKAWNVWVASINGYSKGKENYDIKGYENASYGLVIGADNYNVAKQYFIGYALSYIANKSEASDDLSEVTSDNLQVHSYAGWMWDARFMNVMLNFGTNQVDSSRTIRANNSEVTANFNQFNYGYRIEVGETFNIFDFAIEPTIGFSEQWISQEDYTEKGSVAALRLDRETYNIQHANIGLDIAKIFEFEEVVLVPRFEVMYSKDINGGNRENDFFQLAVDKPNPSKFYSKTGAIIGGDKVKYKAGIAAEFYSGFSIDGQISFTDAEDFENVQLSLNAVKRF